MSHSAAAVVAMYVLTVVLTAVAAASVPATALVATGARGAEEVPAGRGIHG